MRSREDEVEEEEYGEKEEREDGEIYNVKVDNLTDSDDE